MADHRRVRTDRLQLDAYREDDVEAYFAIMSDPGVWRHLPSGVHTTPAQTARSVQAALGHWAADGLGYWLARLRPDLPPGAAPAGLVPGALIGSGGVARREGTTWWNLCYRLTPAAWGHGLAAEIVAAALGAARAVAPDRPVIAYPLEHNAGSRGRAERSGLTLVWRGPDAGNADPTAVRLVYADRPVDAELIARVTSLA